MLSVKSNEDYQLTNNMTPTDPSYQVLNSWYFLLHLQNQNSRYQRSQFIHQILMKYDERQIIYQIEHYTKAAECIKSAKPV